MQKIENKNLEKKLKRGENIFFQRVINAIKIGKNEFADKRYMNYLKNIKTMKRLNIEIDSDKFYLLKDLIGDDLY